MMSFYPYILSFFSILLFSTSHACDTNDYAMAEISIKRTFSVEGTGVTPLESKEQNQVSFQVPHQELFPEKIHTKCRKNAEKGKYLDFGNLVQRYYPVILSDTDVNNMEKAYTLGHIYLEWSTDDLIFRQYCNSPDGRHTLAVLKPRKMRTYYKQQRFDDQDELVDSYTDSRYQIEYWQDDGKWVVEREDFETEAHDQRWFALHQLRKLGKNEPFYKEPYLFAHPAYKRLIDELEDSEMNSAGVSKASAWFHSYLMLSSIFVPALQYGLSSRSFIENERDKEMHPSSAGHSYFPGDNSLGSWLEYSAFAPLFLAKPFQNNAMMSLRSVMIFGAFTLLKSSPVVNAKVDEYSLEEHNGWIFKIYENDNRNCLKKGNEIIPFVAEIIAPNAGAWNNGYNGCGKVFNFRKCKGNECKDVYISKYIPRVDKNHNDIGKHYFFDLEIENNSFDGQLFSIRCGNEILLQKPTRLNCEDDSKQMTLSEKYYGSIPQIDAFSLSDIKLRQRSDGYYVSAAGKQTSSEVIQLGAYYYSLDHKDSLALDTSKWKYTGIWFDNETMKYYHTWKITNMPEKSRRMRSLIVNGQQCDRTNAGTVQCVFNGQKYTDNLTFLAVAK